MISSEGSDATLPPGWMGTYRRLDAIHVIRILDLMPTSKLTKRVYK